MGGACDLGTQDYITVVAEKNREKVIGLRVTREKMHTLEDWKKNIEGGAIAPSSSCSLGYV